MLSNILNLLKLNLGFNLNTSIKATNVNSADVDNSKQISYSSENIYNAINTKYSFLEQESLFRFSRFSNPIISYDYKCGNYIGI